MGWYSNRDVPALFRSADPAWGDENLRELAAEVRTGLFLAHVRAGTGTPVQETNCHPFRFHNWIFVHNGYLADFAARTARALFAVDPDLFGNIAGSTDSELMFHLALTFGLRDDPIGGLERMAGFVEAVGNAADVESPLQMTVGVSDGRRIYAARYASGGEVNTLYVSEDVASIRLLYPENERFAHFTDEARVVLSEPLVDLPGVWREIQPGTALVVGDQLEETSFTPKEPTYGRPRGYCPRRGPPGSTARSGDRVAHRAQHRVLGRCRAEGAGQRVGAGPGTPRGAILSRVPVQHQRTPRRASVRTQVGNQDHRLSGQLQHLDRGVRLRRPVRPDLRPVPAAEQPARRALVVAATGQPDPPRGPAGGHRRRPPAGRRLRRGVRSTVVGELVEVSDLDGASAADRGALPPSPWSRGWPTTPAFAFEPAVQTVSGQVTVASWPQTRAWHGVRCIGAVTPSR